MAAKRHPEDGWVLADPRPMSGPTRRALRGLIRVLCPPAPVVPDLEDRIELHVRRMLQYMVPLVAFGFVLAVLIVDLAPIWRFVAPRRMQHLDRDRAEQLLTDMGTSRWKVIRTMILGIRGIVVSSFYDQDEAHQAMNFHPLPFFTNRIQLRQRLLAGAAPDAEDALGSARAREREREGERR